jgi:hypothetical protein
MSQPEVKRTIDWDKVTGFDDIKAILIAMDLNVTDIPDEPDSKIAGIRYLLHPLPEQADGTH